MAYVGMGMVAIGLLIVGPVTKAIEDAYAYKHPATNTKVTGKSKVTAKTSGTTTSQVQAARDLKVTATGNAKAEILPDGTQRISADKIEIAAAEKKTTNTTEVTTSNTTTTAATARDDSSKPVLPADQSGLKLLAGLNLGLDAAAAGVGIPIFGCQVDVLYQLDLAKPEINKTKLFFLIETRL